ncbi:stage II sporulation protein R [Clostridium collagenovorans DSM 3089]|uniref:Stage II sporulation protein R n=1 Tax=Clostridium collagenovorans DSM 3089 TaxID=1121306 RepID=A0A1M5W3N3_9CLOT|nr:stage II sporulation protein R [Clostridium collagenovorans]SHH82075.1 stage II sporulation protein R [Clostridium collagenovorans DSM 3089]
MKRGIILFLSVCLTVLIGSNVISAYGKEPEVSQDEIADKLIRFHVLANSDSEEDQALKLKVRDVVLEYASPLLKDAKDINESREILNKNNDKIINIAKSVIKENGYSYDVQAALEYENFPVKTYGNITLPSGKYEAYRILIGNAEGRNWWCVMFPPLCFVDVTKGDVSKVETEKEMKTVLTEEEYNSVDNTKSNKGKKNDIKFKFKITEVIDKVLK